MSSDEIVEALYRGSYVMLYYGNGKQPGISGTFRKGEHDKNHRGRMFSGSDIMTDDLKADRKKDFEEIRARDFEENYKGHFKESFKEGREK